MRPASAFTKDAVEWNRESEEELSGRLFGWGGKGGAYEWKI